MLSRREFFLRSLLSAGVLASASVTSAQLKAAQRLVSITKQGSGEYKALLCIYLYGGHDSLNLLLPTEPFEYGKYAQTRQNLAYGEGEILPITTDSSDRYSVGLPRLASGLTELFEMGQLSFVSNVGPLRYPCTKTEILNNEALYPPQLFSHNHQLALWQSGSLDLNIKSGWGGRIADLIMNSQNPLSMNMTLNGSNIWQVGNMAEYYAVDADGPERFASLTPDSISDTYRYPMHNRLRATSSHPLAVEYNRRISKVQHNNAALADALANVTGSSVSYPADNPLARQLKMVANLIEAQMSLDLPRQIFFAGLNGFDTHDRQTLVLPQLLQQLGEAMLAFQLDLGQRGIADRVLTFTQSEFGRTLTSNGDGTDHGWGGHQLIMGNMIRPRRIHGILPSLELDYDDDLGGGRLIPTLSIEQLGAPIARWFGISDTDMELVFPNIGRFDSHALDLFV